MGISSEVLTYLQDQPWPGNVRELQNSVERAVILTSNRVVDVEDFAPPGTLAPAPAPPPIAALTVTPAAYPFAEMTLEEVERRHIEHTIRSLGGQRTKAAEVLGINRTTLWKKLRQYEGVE